MRATWWLDKRLAAGAALLGLLLIGATLTAEVDEATKARLLRLNSVTGNDAMAGTIVDLVKDADGTKKLLAAAKELLQAKKKDDVFNANATIILARAAQGLKDYPTSEQFYRVNVEQVRKLESGQRMVLAYDGLVTVLLASKQFDEAEKVFKEFQEIEGGEAVDQFKERLRRRMAQLLARQGQLDKANEMVEKLLQEDGTNPLNLELKGRILHEAGKLEEAATTYEKLVKTVLDNKRLPKEIREEFADDLRYRLSGVYTDLKKIDKAGEMLKGLLERHPDNTTYNNDLGFIWADHDMNLDEAEKLIRKALDLDRAERKMDPNFDPKTDKDNPAYLDSLGWVLFKKKDYAEAKKNLLLALEQEEGRHLEIYDHLGDCLLKLGEKKEAVEAWKKGLATPIESRRDKLRKVEVEKKIKDAEK